MMRSISFDVFLSNGTLSVMRAPPPRNPNCDPCLICPRTRHGGMHTQSQPPKSLISIAVVSTDDRYVLDDVHWRSSYDRYYGFPRFHHAVIFVRNAFFAPTSVLSLPTPTTDPPTTHHNHLLFERPRPPYHYCVV